MAVDLLLGLQWGDEGKGKIVDVLTQGYDIVAPLKPLTLAANVVVFTT